ncbi:gliding motility-associated C-terminal domain-containing protein [Flavivirga sp. 57AJ16]|uniref:T9SS type B sorting domain-containing protein n=1 Tax=Flavivirga sp. 57AJ16 TaxID=3025307 RepID=UPI00236584AD|nr:gliding motility-associated C-terminal domain-containing protein [Flavivirga sp. 57AJ16]MDD7885296.1 gliding motility-associated C-terminal domain-containing protein [Flavivirga sp. 57AJ16]
MRPYIYISLRNKIDLFLKSFELKKEQLKYSHLLICVSLLFSFSAISQTNISGVINDYQAVSGITFPGCGPCNTSAACLNAITVGDVSAFSIGDKVLIIQMKGATINTTNTSSGGTITDIGNAGNYEFFTISNIIGNDIYPNGPLVNTYDVPGLVQLVRVPNFSNNVNVNGTVSGIPWDPVSGTGGVVAIFVEDTLTLNADIDAGEMGYNGVTVSANGSSDSCAADPDTQMVFPSTNTVSSPKGQGIVVDDPSANRGRSPRANGGGGGVAGDSGGGGGSNYGIGGIGGKRWCDTDPGGADAGGLGGVSLSTYLAQRRVFLGGAGGAGYITNLNPAIATNGGGIVVIRARHIVGNNHTIFAEGADSVAPGTGIDGGGGGGAGGSVAFDIESYSGTVNVDISGGDGQDLGTDVLHGPGGGGGGGVFLHNLAVPPANIIIDLQGGIAGVHQAPEDTNTNGAQDGAMGGIISYYTIVETQDRDGDGVEDFCDLDSDGDGILDTEEAGGSAFDPSGDADGDGIANYLDSSDATPGFPAFTDANGDGVNDLYDNDGDGFPDYLDLDSDNDGIYDVIEAGGVDGDGDGFIGTGALVDTDNDGWSDIADPDNGGTPLTLIHSDADSIPDLLDVDSDGDGCYDAIEGSGSFVAGDLTSSNNLADDDEGSVDSNGVPTNIGSPQGTNSFVTTASTLGGITTQPTASTICEGSNATFTVVDSGDDLVYQWQEKIGAGAWNNLSNTGIYSGTDTATLTLTAAPIGHSGREYRVVIISTTNVCKDVTSDEVGLTIQAAPEAGSSSGAITICSTGSVTQAQLEANLTGEDAGGAWTTSGGAAVSFPITTADTYTYTVTGTGACSAETDTATVVVNVTPAPEAGSSSGAITICSTGSVTQAQLEANLTGEDAGGAWTTSGGAAVSFPITTADTYTYTVTGTGACSAETDTATVVVMISSIDSDGDGVIDCDESTPPSGGTPTDPNDFCNYNLDDVTVTPSVSWNAVDCDGDGVTNGTEVTDGTDPLDGCSFILTSASVAPSIAWNTSDCDGDGVTNGDEVTDGTDPLNNCSFLTASITLPVSATNDCDGDGVTNDTEVTDGTDPQDPCSFVLASASVIPDAAWNAADCDGDGVTNGDEVTDGTDPLDECSFNTPSITLPVSSTADCDGDGVPNNVEDIDSTDPQDPCSFVLTSVSIAPSAAWNTIDCDGDGVTNATEVTDGTDPLDDCSFNTTSITEAVTSTSDCDGDGVPNNVEDTDGTDPHDLCSFVLASASVAPSAAWNTADCDGDGVTNGDEVTDGTDPLDECSFLTASITTAVTSTADCDGDGVTNDIEVTDGTDPQNPCSFVLVSANVAPSATWNAADCDGDGVTNGDELSPPDGEVPTDFLDPCSYRPADITVAVTATANCMGALEVTKLVDDSDTGLGDTITYTIEVENTGNVTITNITLVDTFTDINGNPLTLTEEPVFDDADLGSVEGTLLVGEIATYTATFEINQQAINAGGLSNSVEASGITPSFEIISDVSDDGDDVDGNTEDDPTETELGCLIVINEFSPNGDGVNELLVINCIENYPNNRLEIYNRWGNIVYKKQSYNNEFDGISNGRSTINGTEMLPVGTYYYVLDLGDGSKPKVGWLYINR